MAAILLVLNGSTGGAALTARDLVIQLKLKGHQVYVASPPNILKSPVEVFGEIADGVEEVALPSWNKNYRRPRWKRPLYFVYHLLKSRAHLRPVLRLQTLIRRWSIDIVHTNTALTIDGAIAAKLAGVPHVWHIREEIGQHALFRFSLPEPVLSRVFVGLSERIVTNSKFSQAFFRRSGLESKTTVVYNGLPLERFRKTSASTTFRKKWAPDSSTVLFGMIANVTSHFKRHDIFIRAAARVIREGYNARFVVIGFDPVQQKAYRSDLAYAQTLRKLVRDEELEAHFIWAGYQSDIPSAMNALDVLVHPCEQEGFGRIAVEAMAAKKPVIVSDGGGLSEIVVAEKTGIKVPPGDADSLASAMTFMCTHGDERLDMGLQGYERAKEMFSLENMVAQVDKIYQEIAAIR